MPVKNTSQRQGTQAASGGPDASPRRKREYSFADNDGDKKGKEGGVSFEVFQSEAATFQNIGEFQKAISSYTRVSAFLLILCFVSVFCITLITCNYCLDL